MVHASAVKGCVESLAACCDRLEKFNQQLYDGVRDYPRLQHVLKHQRPFKLVAESQLLESQSELYKQVDSCLVNLIEKASKSLNAIEPLTHSTIQTEENDLTTLNDKLQSLRRKRERLQYMASRIALESQHRQLLRK